MTSAIPTPIEIEILRVNELTQSMMKEYLVWGSKINYGPHMNVIYSEMIDFVNFRMETVESCLLLIEKSRIGDVLGLCRGLLENYLLFILMCRGTRYFRLSDGSAQTPEKFQELYLQQLVKLRERQAAGETQYIDVKIHPRLKQHLQHIFEGIRFENGEMVVPYYYFEFQEFRPEVLRLRPQDYFEYFEHEPETKKAFREHRTRASGSHRFYLSYSALLDCLQLNGILDNESEKRIEAHYTFLGQFIHPTHQAARNLHEGHNVHSGRPTIGMGGKYSKVATLLASLYCCYLVAGYLDELMKFFEVAPTKYMVDPATSDVRAFTANVPTALPYFWFIFNEAPLYDRFNWAVYHVSNEDLARYVHYSKVPSELISFSQHIYSQLQHGLRGWSDNRVGHYAPPF